MDLGARTVWLIYKTMKQRFIKIFALLIPLFLTGPVAQAQVSPWQLATQAGSIHTGGKALQVFLDQSGKRGTDPETVSQVLREAQKLEARGLPTESYLLKANEGLSKGVSPQQMSRGLYQSREQTELAGRLVDQAIAKGVKVDSPAERRRVVQQYQWGLMNGKSSRELSRMTEQMIRDPKKRDLSQLGNAIQDLNQKPRGFKKDEKAEKTKKKQKDTKDRKGKKGESKHDRSKQDRKPSKRSDDKKDRSKKEQKKDGNKIEHKDRNKEDKKTRNEKKESPKAREVKKQSPKQEKKPPKINKQPSQSPSGNQAKSISNYNKLDSKPQKAPSQGPSRGDKGNGGKGAKGKGKHK